MSNILHLLSLLIFLSKPPFVLFCFARILKRATQLLTFIFVMLASISVFAEQREPLDQGIYAYGSLGITAAIGTANADRMTDEVILNTEWDLGFIWKRSYAKPGQKSFVQLAYRPFQFEVSEDDGTHTFGRHAYSLDLLESYAYVRGFSPFVGVSLNYDELRYSPGSGKDYRRYYAHWGFVGGWDLLPSMRSRWMLRSVFRWYPEVSLKVAGGEKAGFPNFEYNFLQFVWRFN